MLELANAIAFLTTKRAIARLQRETILKKIVERVECMPTYEEILTLVQNLNSDDRFRLLEDLKGLVYEPITIEGTNEVISGAEIADSDAALQDYQTGRDRGLSSVALKQRLFGQNVG